MSRIGDNDQAQPIGDSADTARVVVALLRARARIVGVQINDSGDVKFLLPLAPARITRADLLQMSMAKANSLANFIGEYFVRKYPEQFEPLVIRQDYNQQVRRCLH